MTNLRDKSTKSHSIGRKALFGSGILLAAGMLVAPGIYAAFTSQETGQAQMQTGEFDLVLTADGGTQTVLNSVSNVIPGQVNHSTINLSNAGELSFRNIVMSSTVTQQTTTARVDPGPPPVTYGGTPLGAGSSPMTLEVKRCNEPWQGVAQNSNPTCGSGESTVVSPTSISNASAFNLANTNTALEGHKDFFGMNVRNGDSMHLLLTYRMPAGANMNPYQGSSASFTYLFTATQRAAVSETR